MNINEFKANLKGGGARPNRFYVELTVPAFAGSAETSKKAKFLIKASQLPSSILGEVPVPYHGRTLPLDGDRTFEPWTVTCINDTDFALRDAFERWSNAINNNEANQGIIDPAQWMQTARIHQLDKNDNIIKSYTFKNLWPKEIASIETAWDANDQVEEFITTFQYSHWTSNTTT